MAAEDPTVTSSDQDGDSGGQGRMPRLQSCSLGGRERDREGAAPRFSERPPATPEAGSKSWPVPRSSRSTNVL